MNTISYSSIVERDRQIAVERDRIVACIRRHVREDGSLVSKTGRVVAAYSGKHGYRPFPFTRSEFLSKFAVDVLVGDITNLKTGKTYTPNQHAGKKTKIWVDGTMYYKHMLIVWIALGDTEFDQLPVGLVCNHLDVHGGDAITNLELCTNTDNITQRSAVQKNCTGYNPMVGCKVEGIRGNNKNPLSAPFILAFNSSIDSKAISLYFKTELELTTVAEWLYYGDIDKTKPISDYRNMLTARKHFLCTLHNQGKVICNSKANIIPDEIAKDFKSAVEIERIVRNARTDNPRLYEVMDMYIAQGFTGFISKHA